MLSKIVFKTTIAYIYVAFEHNQPANTNYILCLVFMHLFKKQFVSLFKFEWLKALNTHHPTFYA